MTANRPVGYRGPMLCRHLGITYKQLDYWATTGLVPPSIAEAEGSGSQRLYSLDDVVLLKVVRALRDAGVMLPRIRPAIRWIRDQILGRGLPLYDLTLASDGATVYRVDSDDDLAWLLRRGDALFMVSVGLLCDEAEALLARLPGEQAAA